MTFRSKLIGSLVVASALTMAVAQAQTPPFGQEEDTAYAQKVWAAMEDLKLAGEGAIHAFPYAGTDPHGMMLETFYQNAEIEGQAGTLIVKRNYGPEGVTADQVLADPSKHLGAVTIMFKREAGYDAENKDWFYAKYLPDGSLDKNPGGIQLAGRVAKGNAEAGCIACHTAAPGGDFLYTTDRTDW